MLNLFELATNEAIGGADKLQLGYTTMSLLPKFRQYLHPVLERLAFEEYGIWWRRNNDEDWLTQIELKSSKSGDEGLYHVTFDIGFFSTELDELLEWGRQAGFDEKSKVTMPNSMMACHFFASLFDLDDDGDWLGFQENVYLPKGKACGPDLLKLASRLERVIPKAFERYASYDSLIDCKRKKIGHGARSKQASMYAAAACIKLGRYNEALEFLEDAVRPGSSQFMKDVGERLSKIAKVNE